MKSNLNLRTCWQLCCSFMPLKFPACVIVGKWEIGSGPSVSRAIRVRGRSMPLCEDPHSRLVACARASPNQLNQSLEASGTLHLLGPSDRLRQGPSEGAALEADDSSLPVTPPQDRSSGSHHCRGNGKSPMKRGKTSFQLQYTNFSSNST